MTEPRCRWCVSVPCCLLVALGTYVGAYFVVVRTHGSVFGPIYVLPGHDSEAEFVRTLHDSVPNAIVEKTFVPMHWVDCQLRPNLWNVIVETNSLDD